MELACFLRWQLLRLNDTILDLADHRTADLWRAAHDRAQATESLKLVSYRRVLATVIAFAADPSISDQAFRERVRSAVAPLASEQVGNRAAAIRKELSGQSATIRPLIKQIMSVPLDVPTGHPLATALPTLRAVYSSNARSLPAGVANSFPKFGPR
jgi:hypothetical protein